MVIANTGFQQHKATHGHHQMVNTEIRLIIFFAAKDGKVLYSQQKQDWELTVVLIMKSLLQNSDTLKKVGKTTRPFRYDLNQIPYDYVVEVTNRFKGLDLIECLKNYVWGFMTLYGRQWSKPSPRRRNAEKQMEVWGVLKSSWEKKRTERQRRKGKIHPSDCRVPKASKEREENLP